MSEERQPALPAGLDRLFRAALLLVPIGVLANVLVSVLVTDPEILGVLDEFPRRYLLLAIALGLVPWLTNSLRVLIWTRFLGHPLRFREAFQLTLAVDLGSAVSPTAVGGGFFKWGMLVQRGVSPGTAASLTTFPILEDGIFFALVLPVAVLLTASSDVPALTGVAGELQANGVLVLGGAGATAFLTWLVVRLVLTGGLGGRTQQRGLRLVARWRRRLRATWTDAREAFGLIRRDGKSRFALSLSLTAVQWTARYSVISALAAFLGAPVDPVLFWLLQWVVFTLMSFIPTPGAAGGAEAAFYVVYAAFLPTEIIGLATAGWRFLTFYLQLGLAAAIFFAIRVAERR